MRSHSSWDWSKSARCFTRQVVPEALQSGAAPTIKSDTRFQAEKWASLLCLQSTDVSGLVWASTALLALSRTRQFRICGQLLEFETSQVPLTQGLSSVVMNSAKWDKNPTLNKTTVVSWLN